MGLIYRDGRPYLYRSKRMGGRVTSEYVASGESAVLIAQMEAIERGERDDQRDKIRAELAALEADESHLLDYFNRVEDLARAALYAAGFHRPKREWRRRRERRQAAEAPSRHQHPRRGHRGPEARREGP